MVTPSAQQDDDRPRPSSASLLASKEARIQRLEKLQALKDRIKILEKERFQCPTREVAAVNEPMRRARLAVERNHVYSAQWKWVPEPYYSWSLEKRQDCLGAASVQHLCKSLLLENKKHTATTTNAADPTNPKFVLVVIQYAASLDNRKLTNAIRKLRPNVKERLDASQVDFRIASSEDNDCITGYSHNSVTPFGLRQAGVVPIVLTQAVVPLQFFWMGGGHERLKLGVSVSDFVKATSPIVADISQPRMTTGIMDGVSDWDD